MSLREALARGAPLGSLVEEQLRIARRTTPLAHRPDGHEPIIGADADPKRVADLNELRRLRATSVNVDFASCDCFGGETTRLKKAGSPQPFIQAHSIRIHATRYYQPR